MKVFIHDGEEWHAVATGGSTFVEGHSIGVLFLVQTTSQQVFGRLRDIPPEHFDQATGGQLRAALIAALSGDDD